MKYTGFKVNSQKEYDAAVAYLEKMGAKLDQQRPFVLGEQQYVWVRIELGRLLYCVATNSSAVSYAVKETTFAEFLSSDEGVSLTTGAPTLIKLNNEYSAEVTDTEVKVGCQTFPHSKVLEIAEAIKNRKS
jgi:hypothetical protein